MNLGDLSKLPINYSQAKDIAQNGAPIAIQAFGRFLGLGEAEQNALTAGKIPWWTWLLGGLVVGTVAGVRIHKAWPTKVPALIAGK